MLQNVFSTQQTIETKMTIQINNRTPQLYCMTDIRLSEATVKLVLCQLMMNYILTKVWCLLSAISFFCLVVSIT
jgi:hypothetical protein